VLNRNVLNGYYHLKLYSEIHEKYQWIPEDKKLQARWLPKTKQG
jgi:hypothetical protein